MKMSKLVMVVASMSIVISAYNVALAKCYCMCVNNEKQWVCQNSWDVPAGYCGGWCSGVTTSPTTDDSFYLWKLNDDGVSTVASSLLVNSISNLQPISQNSL